MGTIVVLFLLAVAWTWYLVTWLRGRTEHRNVNSISSFSKHLSVLERTTPGGEVLAAAPARSTTPAPRPMAITTANGPVAAPAAMTLSDAQRRRRNVLVGLGAAAIASLGIAGIVGGTAVWALQLTIDALLIGYIVLLARMRALAEERAAKVHPLYEDDAWYEGWEDDESAWDEAAWDEDGWDEADWDEAPGYVEQPVGYLLRSGT